MSGYLCWQCGDHFDKPLRAEITIFGEIKEINLCPNCKEFSHTFDLCCMEPGCKNIATSGTPHKDGYKFHCHQHPPKG